MRKISMTSVVLLAAACGAQDPTAADAVDAPPPEGAARIEYSIPLGPHGQPEDPPMLGLSHPRGEARGGSSGNMKWHNGSILTSSSVTSIFWGAAWGSAAFAGDKIAGLDAFYGGIGGSHYAATNTEYTGSNGQVGTTAVFAGHVVDTSAAPTRAPSTSEILAEVCKAVSSPASNGYYPVYTDTRRGSAGYCAWHSYGTCNGIAVQFAFFFDLDSDAGCDPADTSGLHSQGLASLANVSGHEYAEAVTDPRNGGWYDMIGYENADKCAWTFGAPLLTFSNGSRWKVQGNWSNQAYTARSGYPNNKGQLGCLSGL